MSDTTRSERAAWKASRRIAWRSSYQRACDLAHFMNLEAARCYREGGDFRVPLFERGWLVVLDARGGRHLQLAAHAQLPSPANGGMVECDVYCHLADPGECPSVGYGLHIVTEDGA